MKKLTLSTLLSIAFCITHAQDALVKISPFIFADGTLYTSYERNLINNIHTCFLGGIVWPKMAMNMAGWENCKQENT